MSDHLNISDAPDIKQKLKLTVRKVGIIDRPKPFNRLVLRELSERSAAFHTCLETLIAR